jgi:hypothetical protein
MRIAVSKQENSVGCDLLPSFGMSFVTINQEFE